MTQEVRLWEIADGDSLKEIQQSKLNLEERIENWLEYDISILSNELLVIGRQVGTDFGGTIDILCLDVDGDVVIVELKRDKTPREITAQILDYASWVKDLSNEKIVEIGNLYFINKTTVEGAFRNKFGEDYPEVINESHKMLIVASEIDSSSERIIKYLSDSYGVGINAITFNYFKNEDGKEYLSRVFLIEPSEVEYKTRTKGSSKKSKPLTFEEFQEIADQNGVGNIYKKAFEVLRPKFYTVTRHVTGVAIKGMMGDQKTIYSMIVLYPTNSNAEEGLLVNIYLDRLVNYFNIDKERLIKSLPPLKREFDWDTVVGEFYFKDEEDLDKFLSLLS